MLKGLSKRTRRAPTVPIGAVFRRSRNGQTCATAQVVAIAEDRAGIPHVRYRLRVSGAERGETVPEDRTLSLGAFVEQYPERIGFDDAA